MPCFLDRRLTLGENKENSCINLMNRKLYLYWEYSFCLWKPSFILACSLFWSCYAFLEETISQQAVPYSCSCNGSASSSVMFLEMWCRSSHWYWAPGGPLISAVCSVMIFFYGSHLFIREASLMRGDSYNCFLSVLLPMKSQGM